MIIGEWDIYMDNFMYCLVIGLLIHMGFMASRQQYVCRPYHPTEQCEDGRYEIRFFSPFWDNKKRAIEKRFTAFAEARCVARKGSHLYVEDLRLSAHMSGFWHKPEVFEDQELPIKFTEVCRVE